MNRGLINAATQAVDSQGRIHVVTMHLGDAVPSQADWAATKKKANYFHYWRQADGKWQRNEMNFKGCRPQLRFDAKDNAYLVLTGDRYNPSPELAIATASAQSEWTDWSIVHREPGPFMGQPRLDAGDGASRKFSVYVQEEPIDLKSGKSPLRVIEFETADGSPVATKNAGL